MKIDAEALFYLVAAGAGIAGAIGYNVREHATRKRHERMTEEAAKRGDLR